MKNAIVYLVRSTQADVYDFIRCLNSVHDNLAPYINDFDVLCFHETSFAPFMPQITANSLLPIIFHELPEFANLPDYYKEIDIPTVYHTHDLGYRYMCRFFSGSIFNLEILRQYRYYLRLDSDSLLSQKIEHNLFREMDESNTYYGHRENAVNIDPHWCSEGIRELTKTFVLSRSDIPTYTPIDSIQRGYIYYNNFEICLIDWFRSSPYQDFFKYIDMSGKIMTKRFGDALIRYFGVNYFMEPKRIKQFDIAGYKHY